MTKKQRQRGHGEGSLFQRKDGRWVAQIVLDDGKRIMRYGKTRKEAYEKLQKMQHEQRQGTLVTGHKQTLKQYMEYWLEHVHKPTLKLSTYAAVRVLMKNHILPELGHIQLQKLTIQHVQVLYSKLQEKKLSASRIRFIHTTLHKALDHAVRTGLLSKNVSDSVSVPRIVKREMQVLTAEQAQHLIAAAQGSRVEALLVLALTTGMRRGELLGLKWQDITLDEKKGSLQVQRSMMRVSGHGMLTSEPKTASSKRNITLSPYLVDVLKQHRVRQLEMRLHAGAKWSEHDLVFCNVYGNFLRPDRVYTLFHKALTQAGLPHMRFHDLRHSAATILLGMGIQAKVVQELLGHSDIKTTLGVYAHVLPGMQENAMERMSDLMQQME